MNTLEFNPGWNQVDEVTDPEKLSPNTLAQLDNMRLDEQIGIATTRKGYSRYNQQVDASGIINNLFDVNDVNGNNYLLANIGTKLRKSANGTGAWSDIKTGLTASKMRMAAFGSNFLFANGKDALFYSDLTNTNDFSIETPDVSGVSSSYTTGSITINGFYRYLIVYVLEDGQLSNPSEALETAIFVNLPNKAIQFTGLPVPIDSRIISKQIFRTKVNVPNTYYLVATLAASVTTFTDNILDSALDTTTTIEYLNTPDNASYICSNNDIIFLGNLTKTYTNRVISPPRIVTSQAWDGSTDATPGNIGAGTYKYAYSFVDSNGNESALLDFYTYVLSTPNSFITIKSNGSTGSPSFQSFSLPAISATISGIATIVIVNDPNIKFVRFYRTKAGGSIYYYDGDFIVPQTCPYNTGGDGYSYVDNVNDSNLVYEYPYSNHGATEQVKLPSSIIFSNLNTYLEFPELNYIEIYPDDSDAITGIFDDDNGIMIFKQNSICKLYTNGDSSNWQVQKLVHNVGCDEPDSIYKYQTTYFFVYKNKVYMLEGNSAKEISYKRKTTFDSVTYFLGAAFFSKFLWYALSVQIGSNNYLLCYDLKIDCWYKFSIVEADTVFEKQFGTDKGLLLFGSSNSYITYYNESVQFDFDSGAQQDITVQLKTKIYSYDFVRMRLMFLFIDYYRLLNTSSKQILFYLNDPTQGISQSLNDSDESANEFIYRISTDGMAGALKRAQKIYFSLCGQAISKIYNARLDFNPETWGIPRKQNTVVQGIGMQTGTNTGVNQ